MRVAAVVKALPFDVAFGAEDHFVMAWVVAAGECEGGEFDWERMAWIEANA